MGANISYCSLTPKKMSKVRIAASPTTKYAKWYLRSDACESCSLMLSDSVNSRILVMCPVVIRRKMGLIIGPATCVIEAKARVIDLRSSGGTFSRTSAGIRESSSSSSSSPSSTLCSSSEASMAVLSPALHGARPCLISLVWRWKAVQNPVSMYAVNLSVTADST